MMRLAFDAPCSNQRTVSPLFCGNSPYPCSKLRRIRIAPELVILRSVPRKRTRHLDAVCHLVIGEVGIVGVIVQNEHFIPYGVFKHIAARLILEQGLPIFCAFKVLVDFFLSLGSNLHLDLF